METTVTKSTNRTRTFTKKVLASVGTNNVLTVENWPKGFNPGNNVSLKSVKNHIKKLCESDPEEKKHYLNKTFILLHCSDEFSVKSVTVEKIV